MVKPDTILGWHKQLVAQKFDGSKQRKPLGRPKVNQALEDLVVRLAQENRSWGYDESAKYRGTPLSDTRRGATLSA